jgi:hypothetical protein
LLTLICVTKSQRIQLGMWGVAAVAIVCACTGEIGSSASLAAAAGDDPANDPLSPPGPGVQGDPVTCVPGAVGPSPLRRLSHVEYDHAVRDLLGDTQRLARGFAADAQVGIFANTASEQTIPALLGEQYFDAAEKLAERATVDLPKLLGCEAGKTEAACARDFAGRFGRRAYRRPLTGAEVDGLVALYDLARAKVDHRASIKVMLQAILVSPNFLFRPEFGGGDSATELSPYEVASRLSFLVWGSIPDDTLLDAAEKGQLKTREQIAAQARRLLDDPRSRPAVEEFYAQWLDLEATQKTAKSADVYPEFDDALRGSMVEETRRFVADVLWQGDHRLETLLSAPYSFVDARLAKLYGVAEPASGFARVSLDPKTRAGVLTQATFLAAHAKPDQSSPVKRGEFVRVRLLCDDLPPPPPNVPLLPPVDPTKSTRERFAAHTANPECAGCHRLIDGVGFGFEAYDGIGRHRTTDGGKKVDESGEVVAAGDADGTFVGAVALAKRLSTSAEVRDCAATQWFRYAYGRRETTGDGCALGALKQAFADSKGDLRELIVAFTQTDAFVRKGGE